MKKLTAFLLALLLCCVCSFSFADTAEGFDSAAAAEGILANVNAQLAGNVTIVESDTPGNYSVYYRAADMGCYLHMGSSDPEKKENDKINVSQIFAYDANTMQSYLTFFLCVSAAVEQYVTGEDFSQAVSALSEGLNTAMKAETHTFSYTAGKGSVSLGVQTGSGMILFDFEIRV